MKKELTTRQQSFLDSLVESGGDPKIAAEKAGYASNTHWQVTKALKNAIVLSWVLCLEKSPGDALPTIYPCKAKQKS